MTKKEKLHLQKNNLDKAIAFKEGFFYKVYNEGAFLLKENSFKIQSNGKGDFICVKINGEKINGDSLQLKRLFKQLYLLGFYSFLCA
jgi:hypothetical protein